MNNKISLVIPAYNEQDSLEELYTELSQACAALDEYQIIFIDDASTDNTAKTMSSISSSDNRVACVYLEKNTLKAGAICAGFKAAKHDIVITLDADLQDNPKDIPKFVEKIAQGHDVVSGYRKKRKENNLKVLASSLYNIVMRKISGSQIKDSNCGFKAFKKAAALEISAKAPNHRFYITEAAKQGFQVGEVEVSNRERKYGKSRFSAKKYPYFLADLIKYSLYKKK